MISTVCIFSSLLFRLKHCVLMNGTERVEYDKYSIYIQYFRSPLTSHESPLLPAAIVVIPSEIGPALGAVYAFTSLVGVVDVRRGFGVIVNENKKKRWGGEERGVD